jgi:hypothetical protein
MVLYGCEASSLTLKEENKLQVYQNKALKNISEPMIDEVRAEWKILHTKKPCDLYSIFRIVNLRRL